MTNQPNHEHAGEPQFPKTTEGQRSKRELTAWAAQYRKQAQLEEERDALREKIIAMETELLAQARGVSTANLAMVELVREMTVLVRHLDVQLHALQQNHHEQLVLPETPQKIKKPHIPQIKAWRTWPGFRDDMRERERNCRAAYKSTGVMVTIKLDDLAGNSGGDSLRTIERTMRDYGLDPATAGLPSTWPDEDPRLKRKRSDGHTLAATIAVLFLIPMLDAVVGGRLDGVVHLEKLLGCLFG